METVGNFPDLASAQVAAAALRSEGIDASLPDEHLAGLDWQMGTALHGIRVQVPEADEAAARAILGPFDAEAGTPETAAFDEAADLPGTRRCASCGSDALVPAPWKKRLKALALLFPPALLAWPFMVFWTASLTCQDCGTRSR